jgi:hypothetical protein
MNLFISHFHFRQPILQVYRSVVPFIGLLMLSLAVITYVPALSEWLPAQLAARPAQADGEAGPGGATPESENRTQELLEQLDEGDDEDLEALLDDEDAGAGDASGTDEDLESLLDEGDPGDGGDASGSLD